MVKSVVAATLTFALLTPGPVCCEDAQALPKIRTGSRVRVVLLGDPDDTEAHTIRGTILSIDSNTLTVRAADSGASVNVDRSDVLRVQVKTSGTRGRAAEIGALIGGTIGLLITAGLTLWLSLINEGCSGSECAGVFAIGLTAGGGAGALLGAGVGYALGHDGWRDAYVSQATSEILRRGNTSVRVGMIRGGGPRIELRCSF